MVGDRQPLLLAVTASVPFSDREEAFVQDELAEMLRQGAGIVVVPMRAHRRTANSSAVATGMSEVARRTPLLAADVLFGAVAVLLRQPVRSCRLAWRAIRDAGSRHNRVANALALPKALWLAREARRVGATHIHAYWLSHTSTAAMVASELTGIPWSATGYRWDIAARNALEAKLGSAAFLRCADELGRGELVDAAATVARACPVELVRTGVALVDPSTWSHRPLRPTVLCCPAAFVEKKGHAVLLPAFAAVLERHPDAVLHLFGDGPARQQVLDLIDALRLDGAVILHDTVPLEELRAFLRERPTCVLPSIRAVDGQEEGIPVTLVEAMANGAAVVTTVSGSIPSLVIEGTGLLVAPGDEVALTSALVSVIADPTAADARCRAAADRLRGEFDLAHTAARMIELTRSVAANR